MLKFSQESFLRVGVCLAARLASAQVCSEWLWSNPLPQGNWFNSVAYGGGVFVAVGGSGVVLTSPDGSAWTRAFLIRGRISMTWRGTGTLRRGRLRGSGLYDPEGVFWSPRATGTAATLYRLAWNGTVLAAVGSSGTILTSPDSSSWAARSSGTDQSLRDIVWSGSGSSRWGTSARSSPAPWRDLVAQPLRHERLAFSVAWIGANSSSAAPGS